MTRPASILTLLLCAAIYTSAATWTTIDVPGKRYTIVYGINSAGDMVGTYNDGGFIQRGFLLQGGIFTFIDFPGAAQTFPLGLNDFGQIAGQYEESDGTDHGFWFDGQNYTTLDYPGAHITYPQAINNAGKIVGGYYFGDRYIHGFEWSNGTFLGVDLPGSTGSQLNGLNNLGQEVGSYTSKHGSGGFIVANGVFREFSNSVVARGVNDHHSVVGWQNPNSLKFNRTHSVTVRFPNSKSTFCFGVNNSGQVVGYYDDQNGVQHGFLRTKTGPLG